ncbi:hypothetical protein [Novipirellula rosea]|uniref:GIY-YIG domain-containing protein n=1 Tax=Novipirellula rosea TaxID=1031540 RepID=A0ABP8M4W1_9BACT
MQFLTQAKPYSHTLLPPLPGANGCLVDSVPTAHVVVYVLPSLPGLFKLGFALDSRLERLFFDAIGDDR